MCSSDLFRYQDKVGDTRIVPGRQVQTPQGNTALVIQLDATQLKGDVVIELVGADEMPVPGAHVSRSPFPPKILPRVTISSSNSGKRM